MSIKEKIGIVISTKMQKSIVVLIENKYRHPIYSKTIKRTKKYLVHDEDNVCNVGDKIIIKQTRPLSKRKCWALKEVVK
uniref:Small ribosomal subunit protein uS17c n=1 Tax=Olisthodiscus luteus TaxID=83000 RepID=A0A7U0KSJ4_OLILU|nr:ribosomal protein S17 [Olisthodiscus luteus]QQW50587.1 ribosomal protein S17 [Olisthodiscus luteus]